MNEAKIAVPCKEVDVPLVKINGRITGDVFTAEELVQRHRSVPCLAGHPAIQEVQLPPLRVCDTDQELIDLDRFGT